MAVMEGALVGLLLAAPTVSNIVAERVYPFRRPQGSPYPALVVTRVSGAPLYADDGEVGLQNARVQIDSWGIDYTDAKDLAQAVRSVLSAFSGVSGGINFTYVMLDEERDISEAGVNAAEYPVRVAMDFIVWTRG